jgi:hypothetical protein
MRPSYLPGYRIIFSVIGGAYILLSCSMLVRGMRTAMQSFGLPESTLASPHFADFFHFFYSLMLMLGLLIVALGRFVLVGVHQRSSARLLLAINVYVTYLDVRVSDSPLGNGLYQGKNTIVPAILDLAFGLCFAYLSVRPLRTHPGPATSTQAL